MYDLQLSRKELYELVWTKPMIHIAPKLGVSDRGLGKTCARLEIPVPGRGYWAKVASGHKVERLPLLAPSENCHQMHASFNGPLDKPEPIVLHEAGIVKEAIEFEGKPKNRIIVSSVYRQYDPIVKKTLEALLSAKYSNQGMFKASGSGLLDLKCTKECALEAARIFQALLKGLKQRGFTLSSDGQSIQCYAEHIKFGIREKFKRIPYDPNKESYSYFSTENRKYSFVTSGHLMLKIGEHSDYRKYCIDTPSNPLDEQLNQFMINLAKEALSIKRRQAERYRRDRDYKVKQRLEEALRKTELELSRRADLDRLVLNWDKATKTREFIKEAKNSDFTVPYDDMSKEQWLNWASDYTDKLDPLF